MMRRAARACSGRAPLVLDRHDHERTAAAGSLHGHFVVEGLAQQRAPEGRIHADVAGCQVELVGTDNTVARVRSIIGLKQHPCPEEHARGVRGWLVDDHHALEPPAPEAYPARDFPQAALAVDIFRVLGAIPLGGGGRYGLADPGALIPPETLELQAQAARALRCDVLRTRRRSLPQATHRSESCELCRTPFYRNRGFCGTS